MSFDQLSPESIGEILKEKIKTYPDHPKPGVQFKDLQSILMDPRLIRLTQTGLVKLLFANEKAYFDKILCLDARGFIFGATLSLEFGTPMVMARKHNKLPGELVTQEFEKEYGVDSIQIQKGLILPGDRILIHDDLLATGGTCVGATMLVEACGGKVTGYNYIMELKALNGRKVLKEMVDAENITSLVSFD